VGTIDTFLLIVTTNLGTAFLMFSGLVTFGVTTLAMSAAAGMFLGHSVALSVATLGLAEVVTRTWPYTAVELYGFCLAAASGLPIVIEVLFRDHPSVREAVQTARRRSLALIGHATLVLLIGAGLETASIAVTGG